MGAGIRASCNVLIVGNNATANGTGSGTAGIHITGNGGRIEGNIASNNNFDGILLDDGTNGTTNNFVIRNVARGNGGFQYRISGLSNSGLTGTNQCGPLGQPASATSPWS